MTIASGAWLQVSRSNKTRGCPSVLVHNAKEFFKIHRSLCKEIDHSFPTTPKGIKMRIAVYGLGNVGLVTALSLCHQGHRVIGVEISKEKLRLLHDKKLYIKEKNLDEFLEKYQDRIQFLPKLTTLNGIETIIICVGTPTLLEGHIHLDQVEKTLQEISLLMGGAPSIDVIVRSTVPPGTIEAVVLPILEKGKNNFSLYYQPEFLREGSAVADFLSPEFHVIGVENKSKKYQLNKTFLNTDNIKIVGYRTAEMIKYLNNSFHALKVSYINEIASVASGYGVDISDLMECFLSDKKLNISKKYLRPGLAFGGPCLTKDVNALTFLAKKMHVETPMLDSILISNNKHLRRTLKIIEHLNPRNIVFLGASFKEGTNDLRGSPILDIISFLEKRPSYIPLKDIFIYDNEMTLANIEAQYPPRFYLINKISKLPKKCDLIILGALDMGDIEYNYINRHEGSIIDLGFENNANAKIKSNAKIFKAYEIV